MSNERKVEDISDIIQVLNSGRDFYIEASGKVDSQNVAGVFRMMANVRANAIERLQPFAIIEEGEREEGTSFAVKAREVYTKLLAGIKSDKDHTFIDQLEEVEDKTLEEIKDALDENQPHDCHAVLLSVYDDIKVCHDKMLALQKATA